MEGGEVMRVTIILISNVIPVFSIICFPCIIC